VFDKLAQGIADRKKAVNVSVAVVMHELMLSATSMSAYLKNGEVM
jgi:hypothetical protein